MINFKTDLMSKFCIIYIFMLIHCTGCKERAPHGDALVLPKMI